MSQMPEILAQFNACKNSIPSQDSTAFEKLVTLHAKVLALLAEDYHIALNSVQVQLLQFAAQMVTEGWGFIPFILINF